MKKYLKLISSYTSRLIQSSSILGIAFFCVALFFALNHQMWRDEMQAWLIGAQSNTLSELLSNSKYEGHPILWYLLLMCISYIQSSAYSMQIMHVLLAAVSALIFLKYSPFSRLQKFLFIFGYYPFYEYSTIARNYGIGVLLVFSFCALYKDRQKNYLWIGLILFLLALTNIFGLIVCIAAIMTLLVDWTLCGCDEKFQAHQNVLLLSLFLAIAGVVMSLVLMNPPNDSGFAREWYFTFNYDRFRATLGAFSNAFFPLPAFQRHFWNAANWNLNFAAFVFAPIAIGVEILFIKLAYRNKNWPVLLFFAAGTFGIAAFLYTKYLGYWRHQGHLYIIFIASIWLLRASNMIDKNHHNLLAKDVPNKSFNFILCGVLFFQMLCGVAANFLDYRFLFSAGKEAANYLKVNHFDKLPIAVFPDYIGPSISGYLGNKKFFYPQGNRFGSFVKWDQTRSQPMELHHALGNIKKVSSVGSQERQFSILITNQALGVSEALQCNVQLLQAFSGSANADEDLYVYAFSSNR